MTIATSSPRTTTWRLSFTPPPRGTDRPAMGAARAGDGGARDRLLLHRCSRSWNPYFTGATSRPLPWRWLCSSSTARGWSCLASSFATVPSSGCWRRPLRWWPRTCMARTSPPPPSTMRVARWGARGGTLLPMPWRKARSLLNRCGWWWATRGRSTTLTSTQRYGTCASKQSATGTRVVALLRGPRPWGRRAKAPSATTTTCWPRLPATPPPAPPTVPPLGRWHTPLVGTAPARPRRVPPTTSRQLAVAPSLLPLQQPVVRPLPPQRQARLRPPGRHRRPVLPATGSRGSRLGPAKRGSRPGAPAPAGSSAMRQLPRRGALLPPLRLQPLRPLNPAAFRRQQAVRPRAAASPPQRPPWAATRPARGVAPPLPQSLGATTPPTSVAAAAAAPVAAAAERR